jgi:Protein of unknown function (DUF5818)
MGKITTTRFLIAGGVLIFSQLVYAQATHPAPPAVPAEMLGPPLVAWSVLQQPRPVPQPLPPPDNRPDDSPSQAGQTADSQSQQRSEQTFTGTIARDSGKYVLKVSGNVAYEIEDQEKARPFTGKQVKITGTLDSTSNVLHIDRIDLIS